MELELQTTGGEMERTIPNITDKERRKHPSHSGKWNRLHRKEHSLQMGIRKLYYELAVVKDNYLKCNSDCLPYVIHINCLLSFLAVLKGYTPFV